MKSDFIQPRFDGARFAEHTLPLEVAKDLVAYETLVLELAKRLYLGEHPERQRVPKGFGADFHLHLERVDDGSSKPLLALVTAAALALNGGGPTYFERARDLITQSIAAPEGQLPAAFPQDLLIYFNQIGRSLREDESMELPGVDGQAQAVLTPERRKQLVLAADQVYEREIELCGVIEEADWEKSTFRLRLADGSRLVVPMPTSFHGQARISGGRNRHQVTVSGVGAFDSWDRLQKVVSVETLEVQMDFQLAAKFDEIRSLENNWHDGHGVAPEKAKLDLIAGKLIGHYPEKVALPAIVPTPDGNLLFEWNAPGDPSLDLELATLKADFHAFDPTVGDLEKEFDLSDANEWSRLLGFLAQTIRPLQT